jgi:hypothetical protein
MTLTVVGAVALVLTVRTIRTGSTRTTQLGGYWLVRN